MPDALSPKKLRNFLLRPSLQANFQRLLEIATDAEIQLILNDWGWRARLNQLEPEGDWRVWLLLAGRGFGKTRAGAEWVRLAVKDRRFRRIALIAPTEHDARSVMIEGESGLLAITPEWERPHYEPSKNLLTWSNGAVATSYSADVPDRLRGPQHDAIWADEIAAWRRPETWDMAMLGLRLGTEPRALVTSTPRPVKLIRELLARQGGRVVVTRGSTFDNKPNLAPAFIESVIAEYEGTRLGRQELHAELLEDTPGALWNRDVIEALRVSNAPALKRLVVAVDPAVSHGEGANETGIVVAGLGFDDRAYVLADRSGRLAPEEWPPIVVRLYHEHQADRIVAEANQGGELVSSVLRVWDRTVNIKLVRAKRGKTLRAEPVAALYERRLVHHVGPLPTLEDQMCAFAADFDAAVAGYSPDRVDALVWALTELLLEPDNTGLLRFLGDAAARKKEL
jgi:phage terminase large subunit-like protein